MQAGSADRNNSAERGQGMKKYRYALSENIWTEEEAAAINAVIPTGYFSNGPYVKAFEKEFAQKFGAKYAVMSNSGSSANLLAITAMVYSGRLQSGDEILVPAVSWSTTYCPLSQLGLKIRFVDIDAETLNIDLDALDKAVTPASKAVFAVNLLGNPNDFDRLQALCDAHRLILMEDNCESLGASYRGKSTGTFGVFGTFSSFFSHHICTMEGGMTLTDDEELYHYMLAIRAHGWTRDLPRSSSLYTKNDDVFYERFNFIMPGYNFRPLEMEGAVGSVQLRKEPAFIANRRANAACFSEHISRYPELRMQKETGVSSWFGFAVILQGNLAGKRNRFTSAMEDSLVECRPIVSGNFTKQPALRYMDYSIAGELRNADYIHENGFFVGNHSVHNDENISYLFDVIGPLSE